MTNEEFKEMYQEYNDELYHSWVTSLDPVKRAAQQARQKAYNAAYYLRNKAKWLKYNAKQAGREMKRNFEAHNENWGRGVDMIRDANGRLQRRISSGLDRLTGYNRGYDALSPEQLNARETASRNKAARYQRTARARRRYQQARNRQKTAARNRAMANSYINSVNTREPLKGRTTYQETMDYVNKGLSKGASTLSNIGKKASSAYKKFLSGTPVGYAANKIYGNYKKKKKR